MAKANRLPTNWREFGWQGKRPFESLLPEKPRVFSGRADELAGGQLHPASGCTMTRDTEIWETGGGSMKLVTPQGSGTKYSYFDFAATDTRYRQVLGEVWFRLRSPDWTRFNSLTIYLQKLRNTGITNSHKLDLIWSSGANDVYNLRLWPWTADTWRWLSAVRPQFQDNNEPETWATGEADKWKTLRGIAFKTDAVAGGADAILYLDRVEAPVWPCAFVTVNSEALYKGFQDYVAPTFWKHGWKFSATANVWVGQAGGEDPTIYPAPADFVTWRDRGADISVHARQIDGSTFGPTCTNQAVEDGVVYWANRATVEVDPRNDFRQFVHSFLGSDPSSVGYDTAGALRRAGASAFRGWQGCPDAVFQSGRASGTMYYGTGSHCIMPVIPQKGPYNYSFYGMEASVGGWDDMFAAHFAQVLRLKLSFELFIHNVVATNPGTYNTTITDANAMLAAFKEHANEVEFVSLRDKWRLTYGRFGEMYVNSLNEWKSRRDSSLIL